MIDLELSQVPPSMLETMLNHVEAGYTQNGNPYHNNMHACDVLQTTHYFISQTGLAVSCHQLVSQSDLCWPLDMQTLNVIHYVGLTIS